MICSVSANLMPRGRFGRVEPVLLLLAVLIVAVGALTMRLGPRWPRRLFFRGPDGIVLHHTATGATVGGREVNAETVAQWHADRGFACEYRGEIYHIGYHYVILPDGTVEHGRPEWMPGAHTQEHNDHLGISLVGNFDSQSNPAGAEQPARPTDAQMEAVRALLEDLTRKYGLSADDIFAHYELWETACPGDRFPVEELREEIRVAQSNYPGWGGGAEQVGE